jgi:hypothetical protein
MTHVANIAAVEVPKRLKANRVFAGMPVPFTFLWVDGKPDFTVVDREPWLRCVKYKLCGLCGQKLGLSGMWFIGGPGSMQSRLFFDPPMHRECAEYALKVCPFLATPRDYSERKKEHKDVRIREVGMSPKVTMRFGLAHAKGFMVVDRSGGQTSPPELVLLADHWTKQEWWESGRKIA